MQPQTTQSIQIGDRYEGWLVERLVDRTVLSEVWKTRHVLTGTEAAMKVISEGLVQDQFFLDKFSMEVKILHTLNHPNILAGMGCFPVGDRYGVVTRWVEGWTLEKLIRANGNGLPLEDALPIAISVLETLAQVHANNIFHRDIKPNNIMIEAETLKPFLIDFGIALVVGEPRKTKYGMVLGNPMYMSPEQIQRFHEVDFRSDLYSFGCVLFEMLTGRPPFMSDASSDTEKLYEVQRMQIYEPAPLLREFRADLPVQLEQVVAMALEKDPEQRYASCMEFAEFLKAIEIESVAAPAIASDGEAVETSSRRQEFAPESFEEPAESSPARVSSALYVLAATPLVLGLLPMLADIFIHQSSIARAWVHTWPTVLAGFLISLVPHFRLVSRCWSILPESSVSSPNIAVKYLYFPTFIHAYNRYLLRNRLDLREIPEFLGVVWAVIPFGGAAVWYSNFYPSDKLIALICLLCFWAIIYAVLVLRMCEAINQMADIEESHLEHESDALAANAYRAVD